MKQNRTKKKAGSDANPLAFDGITREELQARLNGGSLVAIWLLREMGLDSYRLFDLYFGPGGAMRHNSLGRRMQATMPFLALLAVHEWLCSEVRKSVKGVEQLLSPLALADAGLPLTAEGRDYVRRLAGTSTSLYEIQAVEDQRVLVASLLDEGAEPEWIARLVAKPDVAKGTLPASGSWKGTVCARQPLASTASSADTCRTLRRAYAKDCTMRTPPAWLRPWPAA